MITKVSKKITFCLAKEHVIEGNQQKLYTYGMELLVSTKLSTVVVLGIGIILHRFLLTLFLIIPFYSIRRYAGGIHAETYARCIASFTLGFLAILFGVE